MLSSISFSFDFPTWLGIIWFSYVVGYYLIFLRGWVLFDFPMRLGIIWFSYAVGYYLIFLRGWVLYDFPTWLGIIWFSCLLICTKLDVSPFLSELLEFALCLRDYPLQKGYVTLCIDDPPGVEYDAVLFFIYVSYHILFVLVHFVCFIIYYMISYHIIYHIISYHSMH
jgi:hypothetical protein